MVSPVLDKLAQERAGQVKLVKVDVDTSPALSQRFDIQAIPTMLLIRDGKVVARQAGAPPAAALRQWLDGALAAGYSVTGPRGQCRGETEEADRDSALRKWAPGRCWSRRP